jgi:hypothetical protein
MFKTLTHAHINLLNAIALFSVKLRGFAQSPIERLDFQQRRIRRQQRRYWQREQRHSSWPYCGARQRARYARQIARGQITASNGLVTPVTA